MPGVRVVRTCRFALSRIASSLLESCIQPRRCGPPMVILEQTAEALVTLDGWSMGLRQFVGMCRKYAKRREEAVPDRESGGDAERALDESHLANNVALWQPANLTFANDVHGFVSADCVQAPSTDRNHWLATTR